jgi:hypothetical protein
MWLFATMTGAEHHFQEQKWCWLHWHPIWNKPVQSFCEYCVTGLRNHAPLTGWWLSAKFSRLTIRIFQSPECDVYILKFTIFEKITFIHSSSKNEIIRINHNQPSYYRHISVPKSKIHQAREERSVREIWECFRISWENQKMILKFFFRSKFSK